MTLLGRLGNNLPLRWKLLLPLLAMMLAVTGLGTFVLVRDQATRAQTGLDSELSQRALEVRSVARDRELYVVESGTFAANLQGMADAIREKDAGTAASLLASVLALKPDLVLASVTDPSGMTLAEYSRAAAGGPITADPPTSLGSTSPLGEAIAGKRTAAALAGFSGGRLLLLAEPICPAAGDCSPVGYAVVGVDARSLLTDPQGKPAAGSEARLALYDRSGDLIASAPASFHPVAQRAHDAARALTGQGADQVATLYTTYSLQGQPAGTLATTLPTATAYGAVHAATTQLVLVFLVAIAGTVMIVAALTGHILRRVSQLVETNRELAAGNLSARAPAGGSDEIGELARGVNSMATSLEDSYATLEARVEQRTADVRRLLDERTEFFTAVSHEFRTPLAVIQAHADMLASEEFEKNRDWNLNAGESISEASRQLLSFVNDILDLSRAERGALDLNREDVDLADVARDLQPSWETLASTAGLDLEATVEHHLPALHADRGRLRQLLSNLVDNAIKYTPPGGAVGITIAAAHGFVELTVTDSGVGIPEDERERIFEPFYRVKSTQPQNGQPSSGVGLALVRRIVDVHQGHIEVHSGEGGTTFVVRLPALSAAADTVAPRTRARRTTSSVR
ncbi:MAG: HAMP domain-containing sensor histidine kinase [Candidatus Dormibacteria bacterium]